jgi:hypothetical protein
MNEEFEKLYGSPRDAIGPKGWWVAEVYGPDGRFKTSIMGHNVVTTVGKDYLASFLVSAALGTATATFTARYVGVGTGSTPETVNDTGLVSEVGRVSGTASHNGTGVYQVVASFNTNSATGAITEYGLFNSSTGGVLFARDTEAVINVGSGDTLTVTAQITFT